MVGVAIVGIVVSLLGVDALDLFRQIGLGSLEFGTAAIALIAREALLQRLFYGTLELLIDRRPYRVGARLEWLKAGRSDLAGDLIDKIVADIPPGSVVRRELRQFRQFSTGKRNRDSRFLVQPLQDIGEPLFSAYRMPIRVEVIWSLHQARKKRTLLERQRLCRFPEIGPGRHFDAPGATAKVNGVEVKLEDLGLAQGFLDAFRQNDFTDLPLIGALVPNQEILDDLLGDGRTTLQAPGGGEIADESADKPTLVDPLVFKEVLILGRDESLLDIFRNLGNRDPNAPLAPIGYFGKGFPSPSSRTLVLGSVMSLSLLSSGSVAVALS